MLNAVNSANRDHDPMLPSDPRFRHRRNLETRFGDLSRTELEWQLLIPGFPAIRTRRCSSFAEANRPKTMEVANIPGFSDHYLLLSQGKRGIVLLESQRKVLWAKSPMFCRA